jgi:Tol biopolymer transport system component
LGTIGDPALHFGPRIAPDGRRVAVARLDPRTRLGDIHVLDDQGADLRLTFAPGNEIQPVWTPDGNFIIYGAMQSGRAQLLRKRADGAGADEVLHESDYNLAPDDVSADGTYVIFRESHPVTQNDLWVLPLDGSGKARPILNTAADEPRARFSPDGKIVTFIADGLGGPSRRFRKGGTMDRENIQSIAQDRPEDTRRYPPPTNHGSFARVKNFPNRTQHGSRPPD